MITGIIEVTQDPEQAGSTLKILSLRLRGMKGQLQELGEETDENVENISKMQGQILNLTNGKVNIFDGSEFRSTYEIMNDIAEVWDDLSSTAQADLLETIAGKHRANSVAALLSNWENVEAAVKSASEAEGSAARENAKYVDSIQGRLDKMTTSWQSFANTFMSSDFLKGAISGLTSFIEGLEKVIETVGTFPTLMGTIAAGFSMFKNKGFFSVLNKDIAGAQKQLSLFGKSFTDIKRDFSSGQNIFTSLFSKSITKADVGYITEYFNQVKSGVNVGQAYANTLSHCSVAGKKMAVNIKSGKVSMDSLKTATHGSKLALFGLEAAATAANIALTMGISLAIQGIVNLVSKWINADKELAESVEELTSKYKEQSNELQKLKSDFDTSNEESMISKYEKLSKGVDALGRNVSLTADEYSEYQSIVNQIADQIPSLVSGYDEQGNAILSCKGNVEQLTEAYEKMIHAQNQEVLTNSGDIEENFSNMLNKMDGQGLWSDGHGFWAGILKGFDDIFSSVGLDLGVGLFSENYDLKGDTVERLERVLGANKSERKKIYKEIEADDFSNEELRTALERAGVEIGYFDTPTDVLEEVLEDDPQKIKGIIDDYYTQFAEIVEQQKTIASAKLSEAFDVSSVISGLDYSNISEELQTIAYQVVNSLDFDFFEELSESGKTIDEWVEEMLDQLNAVGQAYGDEIEDVFALQGKFNSGEIAYGEYVKELKEFDALLDDLNLKSEVKDQIKISVGLDEGGVVEQYETLVNRLTSKNYDFNISTKEAQAWLSSLSSEDLALAVEIITETSNNGVNETIAQLQAMLDKEKAILGLSLEIKYDDEKAKLDALATALSESVSGSGLSTESLSAVAAMFSEISGYNPAKLFERTANGVRLNTTEFRKLNNEYKKKNIRELNENMSTLGDAYIQTRDELSNLAYGTDEYNDKLRELGAIEDQINAIEQLTAGYEGLASAYQEWQMIEAAGSQRDMYEGIIEGFENVGDEISRGWYDDGTIEFLELLTGKDLSTANLDELKKTYRGLRKEIEGTSYSITDFFTVDEDGNSTSTGVNNFLKAVNQLEGTKFGGQDIVKMDGNKVVAFDFQVVGGDKAIADALGISEELVQILKRAADDAGFVVSMDGTYQQLDVLVSKAKTAAKTLKETFKSTNYDFFQDSSDAGILKDYEEAMKLWEKFKKNKNADGSINMSVKGAQEAYTLVSTLQSMVDRIKKPTYMELNTDDVEKGLQTPLQKLQEYQTLVEQEHQLKLKGTDTSQLQEDKEKILDYFEELSPEIKASLGIKGDSRDELWKKLEEGKIEVPAVVDLQVEMNETLKDMVNVALYNAGLIDKGELEARVNVAVYANDVDTSDVQEKVQDSVEDDGFWAPIKTWWKNLWTKDETEKAQITIKEAEELLKKLEDKDITIDVTVKGVNDVVKLNDEIEDLNKEIDLTTKIQGNVDKLSEYVEGAKVLSELDDEIVSNVSANVYGNITETAEFKINNLKVFGESAEGIKDLGDVESEVNADVYGNVTETSEAKLNNLKVFTDSAKDIGSIGNVESEVTANVEGDVIETSESKLNNLKVFTDSAKDIDSIGDASSTVTAEVKGDVTETAEFKLNNLKVFTDSAKDIKDVDSKTVNIVANAKGNVVDTKEGKLNNLKVFTDNAKDIKDIDSKTITITTNVEGNVTGGKTESKINNLKVFTDSAKDIENIDSKEITITANVDGNVVDFFGKTEGKINNLKVFTDSAKDIEDIDSKEVSITANVDGNVFSTMEKNIDNLDVFAKGAKALKDVDNVSTTVTAKINSGEGAAIDEWENQLDDLMTFAEGAKALQNVEDASSTVYAQVEGNAIGKLESNLNDLTIFAEGAKALQGIGDVSSTVTAKIDTEGGGDVINRFEGQLNNLKVFAEGAEALKDVGSPTSIVTARINTTLGEGESGYNATDLFESEINNLNAFADGANAVKSVGGDVSSTVTAKINTGEGADAVHLFEGQINNLSVFAENAQALQGLEDVSVTVTAKINTEGSGDVINKSEETINKLTTFANAAKELSGIGNPSTTVTAKISGNAVSGDESATKQSLLSRFKSIIQGMSSRDIAINVTANVDAENIQKAIELLTDVKNSGVFKNYKASVKVGAKVTEIDDSKVDNYKVPKKDGKVSYSVDPESSVYTWTAPPKDGVVNYEAEVEALTYAQKNKTGTITYTPKISGGLGGLLSGLFPVANGTANANGTAFANGTGKAYKQGDWGVKKTTTALTGELGQELIVYKNRFWTVGDRGAEFTTIPKGAIVFNHKQTAELFANGKVTSDGGRGKMFANGTAYANGTAHAQGVAFADGNDDGVTSQKKTIDWVEKLLNRFDESVDKLEKAANNIYDSWSNRNVNLNEAITKAFDRIGATDSAVSTYTTKADKAASTLATQYGSEYVNLVQNGAYNIEDFDSSADEGLIEAIENYEELYNKQKDAEEAAKQVREEFAALNKQKFDDVIAEYDGILQKFEHTSSMIDEYISQSEAQGHIVSTKYYEELRSNKVLEQGELENQRNELLEARNDYVNEMKKLRMSEEDIKNSEAWLDMCKDIDDTTLAIEKCNTELLEYKKTIRELEWEQFDLIQERISNVTDEADFLIELMSHDKLHNDDGSLTDKGMATMGQHGVKYNAYMYKADEFANEIKELNDAIAQAPYNEHLIERRQELIELQRESILNAEQEKESIKSLIEQGIDKELEALDEKIQKYEESMQSARDLYDYEQKVSQSTKNISSLEKQLKSYEGFDDEETKAKVQKLKVEFEEAKADLESTQYDKYISDQSALLDDLALEYENVLNSRLDNVDELITQVIGAINIAAGAEGGTITTALGADGAIAKIIGSSTTTIGETLTKVTGDVGTSLSNSMKNIWLTGDGNVKGVLTTYGTGFQDKQNTTNVELGKIKSDVAAMVDDIDKEAQTKVASDKTQSSSTSTPAEQAISAATNVSNIIKGAGNGKPQVGDKVKFLSGKYYYDSLGVKPLGSRHKGEEVYITNINTKSWATHPYHISTGKKLGQGDLGWLKLNQLSGYATGKKNFLNNEIAWTQEKGQEFIVRPSDGAILTPIAKGDSVLNAQASGNIWDMANSPAEFIKDNLNLGVANNVPNNSNVQNSCIQNFENITFSMPNVRNYEELVASLQKDPKFDKLIKAMTLDQIAGRSSLAKNKSIR